MEFVSNKMYAFVFLTQDGLDIFFRVFQQNYILKNNAFSHLNFSIKYNYHQKTIKLVIKNTQKNKFKTKDLKYYVILTYMDEIIVLTLYIRKYLTIMYIICTQL